VTSDERAIDSICLLTLCLNPHLRQLALSHFIGENDYQSIVLGTKKIELQGKSLMLSEIMDKKAFEGLSEHLADQISKRNRAKPRDSLAGQNWGTLESVGPDDHSS
jgi:hypothetical protein